MTLHHRLDGDGDRVLVLSGSLGSTLEMWDAQVQRLSTECRIVRYDHPGHGGSPVAPRGATATDFADGVLHLLDELGVERFSFAGLSLGGLVGMELALSAQGRLERLVLCCTAAKIGTPRQWADRAATVRRKGVETIADAVVARWFTRTYAAAEPETVQRYRAMLLATPPEGYARCCEVLAAADLRERLDGVDVPTLVVAGDEDPVVPVDHAADLQRRVRGSRLVVMSPAAHLANVERHEDLNRELLAHLGAAVAT